MREYLKGVRSDETLTDKELITPICVECSVSFSANYANWCQEQVC